nr:MAG TPA: hypothetical protein [Caudoviricetes sp.]
MLRKLSRQKIIIEMFFLSQIDHYIDLITTFVV